MGKLAGALNWSLVWICCWG